MNHKIYSIIMGVVTLLASFGFFVIIFNFDPNQANWRVFALFYLTLFLGSLGALSLLGFWLRRLFKQERVQNRLLISNSLRQGLIMSLVVVLAMWMQSARLLTWWNTVLLALAAAALEFVILLFRRNPEDSLLK